MPDDTNGSAHTGGAITPVMVQYLRETRPWVLLLGVLGFVGVGFMVLGGLGTLIFLSVAPTLSAGRSATVPFVLSGVFYIVMGLLYFFPAYFLVRYGAAIG